MENQVQATGRVLHRAAAVPRASAEEPRTAAAVAGHVQRQRPAHRTARRRAGAGLHQPQVRPDPVRGRGHPLPHSRGLDLHVPRRETLPLRIRQVVAPPVLDFPIYIVHAYLRVYIMIVTSLDGL